MDSETSPKVQPVARKVKKKPVKDEIDRIKQAEKKRRRLEKALATSAAICSELEKKKQKKKEEQERLDDEGAAIAEAVALHVLLGEDSDDSCKVMLNNKKGFINHWEYSANIDLLMDKGSYSPHNYAVGWISNAYGLGGKWVDWSFSYGPFQRNVEPSYIAHEGLSADLVAAQAVSSLQISDAAEVDTFVLNGMLRG